MKRYSLKDLSKWNENGESTLFFPMNGRKTRTISFTINAVGRVQVVATPQDGSSVLTLGVVEDDIGQFSFTTSKDTIVVFEGDNTPSYRLDTFEPETSDDVTEKYTQLMPPRQRNPQLELIAFQAKQNERARQRAYEEQLANLMASTKAEIANIKAAQSKPEKVSDPKPEKASNPKPEKASKTNEDTE